MDRSGLYQGVRDVIPLLLGIVPFGFIAGIATVNAGLGLPEAIGLSVIVFAGEPWPSGPLNPGLLVGATVGIVAGVFTEGRLRCRALLKSGNDTP